MTERKIYRCGEEVVLKLSKLPGIIASVNIEYSLVTYKVKFFIGGEYRMGDFSKDEFYVDNNAHKKMIGYKVGE